MESVRRKSATRDGPLIACYCCHTGSKYPRAVIFACAPVALDDNPSLELKTPPVTDKRDLRNKGALHGGSPMSHVEFKKWLCPLSLFLRCPCRFQNGLMSHVEFKEGLCHVDSIFLMSIGPMSHVEFKKQSCRPVEFKGQGP